MLDGLVVEYETHASGPLKYQKLVKFLQKRCSHMLIISQLLLLEHLWLCASLSKFVMNVGMD